MDPEEIKDLSPQTFLKMQCGRIDLSNPVQKAFILMGKTKAGKTTSMHYMMHHSLKGAQVKQFSPIIYKLDQAKQIYKQARIGYNQSQSQTQIPNYFKTQIKDQSCCAIDLPGFSDTYGCFRAVSNRYFTHKVFSQVKKIKFIIVIAYIDMLSTADGLKKAFTFFFQSFRNFNDLLPNILPSINLLFTGVPNQFDDKAIIQRYSGLKQQFPSTYQQIYAKVKKSLIQNKQIFLFKQAILDRTCDTTNNLLQRINQRSKWWERKIYNNKIDISQIRITLADYKDKDEKKFMKQLLMLSKFMEKRLKQISTQQNGLVNVIRQLIQGYDKDAQYVLSGKVKNFLQQNQIKGKKQSQQYISYYSKYAQKRKNAQAQQFRQNNQTSAGNSGFVNYRFEKIQAIKKISSIVERIMAIEQQRNINTVSLILQCAKQILMVLLNLVKDKKQYQKMRKYAHAIYSSLQIMKQIYNLLFNTSKELGYVEQGAVLPAQFQPIYLQFPGDLKGMFIRIFSIKDNPYTLIINFIESISASNNYSNLKAYDALIKFIKSCELYILNDSKGGFKDSIIKGQNRDLILKRFNSKILQLQNKRLQFKVFSQNQLQLGQLIQHNKNIQKKINQCQISPNRNDPYDDHLCQNLKINQLISYQIKKKDMKMALQIFQSLNDAHQILEYYRQEEKNIKYDPKNQQSKQKMLNFLIDYMKKAYKYSRVELAIQKAQHAYSIAQMLGEKKKIQKIGKFLFKICPVSYEQSSDQDNKGCETERRQYIQTMNNGLFKVELNDKVTEQLQKLCQKDRKQQPKSKQKRPNQSPSNQKKPENQFKINLQKI